MQFASDNSPEPLLMSDSDWLVRVESDNARISSRISASRSGGSGDMLIYVIDAADLQFCLRFGFSLLTKTGICITCERQIIHYLSPEAGATHIGMFIARALLHWAIASALFACA